MADHRSTATPKVDAPELLNSGGTEDNLIQLDRKISVVSNIGFGLFEMRNCSKFNNIV